MTYYLLKQLNRQVEFQKLYVMVTDFFYIWVHPSASLRVGCYAARYPSASSLHIRFAAVAPAYAGLLHTLALFTSFCFYSSLNGASVCICGNYFLVHFRAQCIPLHFLHPFIFIPLLNGAHSNARAVHVSCFKIIHQHKFSLHETRVFLTLR